MEQLAKCSFFYMKNKKKLGLQEFGMKISRLMEAMLKKVGGAKFC